MQILDPIAFFEQLGGLHDVDIERLDLQSDALSIRVGDLYGNFEGLPGYTDPLPGTLTFSHVENVDMAIESGECLTIYSLDIGKVTGGDRWNVELRFVPAGRLHLSCSAIEGDFDPKAVLEGIAARGMS
jgi:hypothetical protein